MLRLRHYRESDVEAFLSRHYPAAVEGGEPDAIVRTIDCLEVPFPDSLGDIEGMSGVVLDDPVNEEGLISEGRRRVLRITAAPPRLSVDTSHIVADADVPTPSSIVTLPLSPSETSPRTCPEGVDEGRQYGPPDAPAAEGPEERLAEAAAAPPVEGPEEGPAEGPQEAPAKAPAKAPAEAPAEGAPDPPVSVHRPTFYDEEPEWLQYPPEIVTPGTQPACTMIRCGSKTEITLEGKIPPNQLAHISRQNASLITQDKKMTRVFRVRNALRVGSLTVDLASWDEQTSSYQAKAQTRSVTPPARLSFPAGEFLRRHQPVDRDRNVVPVRLPFAGDGSVARLHRMKMRELSRR